MRINCAMPRASLRSVFTGISLKALRTCRVSSSSIAQTRLLHAGKQPLRKWAGFQPDPRNIKAKVSTPRSQSFRFAGYLGLANNPPGCVHHADARAFQRYINSGIVLHGRPFDDAWSRAIPDSVQSHHHSEGRPLPTPLPVGRPVTPELR